MSALAAVSYSKFTGSEERVDDSGSEKDSIGAESLSEKERLSVVKASITECSGVAVTQGVFGMRALKVRNECGRGSQRALLYRAPSIV